jgi:hypothetical protein
MPETSAMCDFPYFVLITVPLNPLFYAARNCSLPPSGSLTRRSSPLLAVRAAHAAAESKTTLGFFFFFCVLYSTLLHLPPLRFHCADGCWDRTQDLAVRRSIN